MTIFLPASPNTPRSIARWMAIAASSGFSATTTPLPNARPSAFTTSGYLALRHHACASRLSGKFFRLRRRNPVPLHKILRENLRGLEPRRCGAWAENPQPLALKSVHDTRSQSVIRPDDSQADRFTLRKA